MLLKIVKLFVIVMIPIVIGSCSSKDDEISNSDQKVESIMSFENEIYQRVESTLNDNLGLLDLPRIFYHVLFCSDATRKNYWMSCLSEQGLSQTELDVLLEKYLGHNDSVINDSISIRSYEVLNNVLDESVVNLIVKRERCEVLLIFFDFLIAWIVGYIVGFIFGFFFGLITDEEEIPNWLQIIIHVVTFVVVFWISVFMIILPIEQDIIDGICENLFFNLSTLIVI